MLTINGLSFFGPITRGFPEGLRGVELVTYFSRGVVKGVTLCDRGERGVKKS